MKFGPEASGVNLEEISQITDGKILVLAFKKKFWPSNHYLDLFGIFPADVATALPENRGVHAVSSLLLLPLCAPSQLF